MLRSDRKWGAVIVVTGLAIGGGALLGAATIATFLGTFALRDAILGSDSFRGPVHLIPLLALGAAVGATFGLVLGPLTAFGLLREVPLWKAIVGTGLGGSLGFIVAMMTAVHPFVGVPVGFLLGALYIRARHGHASAAAAQEASGQALPPGGPLDDV